MMHVANFARVLLLLANLTGAALLLELWLSSWWLARAAAPLIAAFPFFLEHFVGLGSLHWMWPAATIVSFAIISLRWRVLAAHWRIECVYVSAFAYALAWRYAFPDIDASSEKLTDLTFISNYLGGGRLPPADRWLPPFRFDIYYSLQHYGAALMARIFAMPAGTAYNLAICVIAASTVTAAAGTAWLLTRRRGATMLLMAALIVGGTGVSPFIRLIMPAPPLYSSIRFMGGALAPENATRPLGRALIQASGANKDSLDLPVELFSYLIGLGDFHPPLGGYLVLALTLLSIARIESAEAAGPAFTILGAALPLTIAVNAWDLPLELFLAAGWLCFRVAERKKIEWKALGAGFACSVILLAPYLAGFLAHSLALHTPLRLVPRRLHTPLLPALLIFYPVFSIVALQLIFGERSRQSLAFCATFLALAAASELFFIDDVYSGKYERFNTVLKWWPWIYSATLLVIGALNLRSCSRICRAGTAAVLILICGFAGELAAAWWNPAKPHAGQLDGAAWLRDDAAGRAMLAFLSKQPPAIVLQRLPDRAYTAAPALAIFSGHAAFLGWPNHEDIWRGYPPQVDSRAAEIEKFYRAELPDSVRWLEHNAIRYIIWSAGESGLNTFAALDARIRGEYSWRPFSEGQGIWRRAAK